MVAMAFSSTTAVQNQPVSPEYLNSVEKSWEATQGVYAEDSLQKFTELVDSAVVSNPTRSETESAIASMIEDGSYDGNQERVSTYENWSRQATTHSNKLRQTNITSLDVEIQNLSIETTSRFSMQTKQMESRVEAKDTTHISGVEDLLLKDNGIDRKINRCSHDVLAKKLFDGSSSNGAARGNAVIEPDTSSPGLDNSDILVTSDVTQYSDSDVMNAKGYFSQTDPGSGNRLTYNENYTVGTSKMPGIRPTRNVIIHEGLWTANFEESINTGCYMPTSLTEAPNIIERLNLDAEGSSTGGAYTMLNPSGGKSDIAFERINTDSENLVGIETVSVNSSYPGFKLSADLAAITGLDELIK